VFFEDPRKSLIFGMSVSFEEKETSVRARASTLALFQYPERTKFATGLPVAFFLIYSNLIL
jgi:hypothetical protein